MNPTYSKLKLHFDVARIWYEMVLALETSFYDLLGFLSAQRLCVRLTIPRG